MDKAQAIREARAVTGENLRSQRDQLPAIKFYGRDSQYGKAGTFALLRKAKDGKGLDATLLGTSISATILKVRMTADNGNKKPQKRLYEFDSPMQDSVELRIEGQQQAEVGSYKEHKENHPDLKFRQVLYLYFNGEVCKMKVSGGSLKNLWEYLGSFGPSDTVMAYKTLFGSETVEHPEGAYQAFTFKRGEPEEKFEEVLDTIRTLATPRTAMPALPAVEPASDGEMTEEEIADVMGGPVAPPEEGQQ